MGRREKPTAGKTEEWQSEARGKKRDAVSGAAHGGRKMPEAGGIQRTGRTYVRSKLDAGYSRA